MASPSLTATHRRQRLSATIIESCLVTLVYRTIDRAAPTKATDMMAAVDDDDDDRTGSTMPSIPFVTPLCFHHFSRRAPFCDLDQDVTLALH